MEAEKLELLGKTLKIIDKVGSKESNGKEGMVVHVDRATGELTGTWGDEKILLNTDSFKATSIGIDAVRKDTVINGYVVLTKDGKKGIEIKQGFSMSAVLTSNLNNLSVVPLGIGKEVAEHWIHLYNSEHKHSVDFDIKRAQFVEHEERDLVLVAEGKE